MTLTLTAYDAYGNVATNTRDTVQIQSPDHQATGVGNYTFTAADNGVHTFTVVLKTAGTQQVVVADTSLPLVPSVQIQTTVKSATATHFGLSVKGSTLLGSSFSLQVEALDAYGNIFTGFTGTVQISSSVSGTLPAPYTFTAADKGVHTFSGLKVVTHATSFTLTVHGANGLVGTITVRNNGNAG